MLHSSGLSKKATGAPEQSSGLSAFAAYRAVTQHASRSQVFMPITDYVSPPSGVRCLTLRDSQAKLILPWAGARTHKSGLECCPSETYRSSATCYMCKLWAAALPRTLASPALQSESN